MPSDDAILDRKQTKEYLDISIPTLDRWRRLNKGPRWVKMGGAVRYRKSDLDQYLNECTRGGDRSHKKRQANHPCAPQAGV